MGGVAGAVTLVIGSMVSDVCCVAKVFVWERGGFYLPVLCVRVDFMTSSNSSSNDAVGDSPVKRYNGLRFFRDIVVILLVAVVVSFLLKTFLVQSFYIPSQSMENTLMPNDRILVSVLTPKTVAVSRGDVVVFSDPGKWLVGDGVPEDRPANAFVGLLEFIGLVPPTDNNHLVKRVIGLPGDHVSFNAKVSPDVMVNGVPISEPYVLRPKNVGLASDPYTFNVVVPKGDVFVLGDNRWDSADSAYHAANPKPGVSAFVPEKNIVGQAVLVDWPTTHWKFLGSYPNTFKNVPKVAGQ